MRVRTRPQARDHRPPSLRAGEFVLIGLLFSAAIAASPAPMAASDGVTAYPAAYFAPGNPATAYDMVQRVPGFTFAAGDVVRGFAGAAGNVLVDGQRPTSKATTLDDILRRIPAETVERVELIRGGAPGIDMQGRAVLVNVVRSKTADTDASAALGFKRYGDSRVRPQAEIVWSQRRGQLALSAGLLATNEMNVFGGDGAQTRRRADGSIYESGPLSIDQEDTVRQATAEAVWTGVRDTVRVNGVVRQEGQGYAEQVGVLNGAGRPISTDRAVSDFTRRKIEVGGDYERILSPTWTARILALQVLQKEERDGLQDIRATVVAVGERGKLGESIARFTLTNERSPRLVLEAGAEAAFNLLDASSTRFAAGAPVVLPNANVRVEERRGEMFAKLSWRPGPRFSLDLEPRAEVSRISQTGDTNASKSFFFPKPRLLATWSPAPQRQLRVRLEREVGQLNFRDFAASSAIDAGTVNAGNADLEPERAWVAEAAIEQRFWGRGSVVLTYQRAWIEQVVDLIPVGGLFDAPGNIGDGKRDQVAVSLTLPLDKVGIKGGLLRGSSTWRWTEVTDPVTGRERPISGVFPQQTDLHFSQDLRSLRSSWGIDYISRFDDTSYRINEIRRNTKGVWFVAFWEWRPRADLSVRGDVTNFTSRSRFRYREQYVGSRAGGVLAYRERRAWQLDPIFTLRVRKLL